MPINNFKAQSDEVTEIRVSSDEELKDYLRELILDTCEKLAIHKSMLVPNHFDFLK